MSGAVPWIELAEQDVAACVSGIPLPNSKLTTDSLDFP
jgi:hypothetical protein